ncbi:MAG: sensor histidine kinase [Anaerolineales bacterium]|jgi:signal transduction histidine kinase
MCPSQDNSKGLRKQSIEAAMLQRRLIDNVEAERLHLAQDLHDGPIQDLYSISYQLKELLRPFSDGRAEVAAPTAQEIAGMLETTQKVIDHLRGICGELRPPTLVPFGLEKAIRSHIETAQRADPDLQISLDLMADDQNLPEGLRLALFRIYQHAASNVVRHAHAKHLQVEFKFDHERAELVVRDDGSGFDLPPRWEQLAQKGHFGLIGTAERVAAIGGDLSVETSSGKGTEIRVRVPLRGVPDYRLLQKGASTDDFEWTSPG